MGKNYNITNAEHFAIVVNLYIIYKVYKLIGNKRHEKFNYEYFYRDVLHISRERFLRIRTGANFNLTEAERTHISSQFNIEKSYFSPGAKIISINNLNEGHWKCLFREYFGYNMTGLNPGSVESRKQAQYTEDTLKREVAKMVGGVYDRDSMLYRIYHYFVFNSSYHGETKLDRFLKELGRLEIEDWGEIKRDGVKLKKYGEMLEQHSRYIQAVLTCMEFEKQ